MSVIVLLEWVSRASRACGAWCVFVFQAEDGIRDLVRSRGLGDVYKRQAEGGDGRRLVIGAVGPGVLAARNAGVRAVRDQRAVSYTHLTLPTSDLV